VQEIAALTELSRSSNLKVVAGGVERGLASDVKTAVGVATHPVMTVTGIPRGIAHRFHGYAAKGASWPTMPGMPCRRP
jgi:hypothetical protein